MEQKRRKIRVEIAEKPYTITLSAPDLESLDEEESTVRKAAANIRELVERGRKHKNATLIDLLAMAALDIAIENEQKRREALRSPTALRLRALEQQLDAWRDGEDG